MNSVSVEGAAGGSEAAGSPARVVLTADMVLAWLQKNPGFFETEHEVLSQLRLRHPHDGRAVSLIERQVAVLRDRNRMLEKRLAELLRIGRDNDALLLKMQALAHAMLGERDPLRLPAILTASLKKGFDVPEVLVRLWAELALPGSSTGPVSDSLRHWADRLEQPYCGACTMDEVSAWFPEKGAGLASMAVMPLRAGNESRAFGVLVLASPEPGRFQAGMGTALLEQLADMAGAALSRALSPAN